ncbi:hypothetical protein [Paracoccus sp. SSK6]|uniref:hypothetical protein n=1 Tax=Paracoccus sp. SSK6 TaxID=3143131 RepID=UPI00321A7E5D
MTDLRTIIDDLRARLVALPRIDSSRRIDIMDQHRALDAAAKALGEYLVKTYGARIQDNYNGSVVSILKVKSSSTMGLPYALQNWIAAAERCLAEDRA